MSEIINNALSIGDVSNVWSEATGLTRVSNSVSGTLSSSDLYDWYKFTPTSTGTVNISLAGLSQDADIKLYSATSLLGVSERSGTASESIQYQVNSGQQYYLAVNNYSKKSTNYTLSVELPSSTSKIWTPTYYYDDFTNTTSTTGTISVGGTKTGNIGVTIFDRDWFKIQLNAGQKIQVDLKGSPTGSGTLSDTIIGGIYNSSGSIISNTSHDDISSTNRNSQVTFTAATAGTYYIEAKAYGTETGTYTLSVTGLNSGPAIITQDPVTGLVGVTQGYNTTWSHGKDGKAIVVGGKVVGDPKAKWAIDFDTNGSHNGALSIGEGTIAKIEYSSTGYGNHVTVKHTVDGSVFYATYAHLSSISDNLEENGAVGRGTELGKVGNTGNGFGEHLHLQLGSKITGTVADGSSDDRPVVYFSSFIKTDGSDGILPSSSFQATDIIGTTTLADPKWDPDRLFGTNSDERIFGLGGNDYIDGKGGNDTIYGGRGNDTIDGGLGFDALYGNSGSDKFVISTKSSGNTDRVYDFVRGEDKIEFSKSVFGNLTSSNFSSTGSARDSNDYIVYNQSSGEIYYDSDGSGSQAQVRLMVLDTKPQLTASDFVFIA